MPFQLRVLEDHWFYHSKVMSESFLQFSVKKSWSNGCHHITISSSTTIFSSDWKTFAIALASVHWACLFCLTCYWRCRQYIAVLLNMQFVSQVNPLKAAGKVIKGLTGKHRVGRNIASDLVLPANLNGRQSFKSPPAAYAGVLCCFPLSSN